MFESMYKAAAGNKLDPYNVLAGRASGEPQFKPGDVGGDTASMLANAATLGAMKGVPSGGPTAASYDNLSKVQLAGGNIQQPSYDAFAAAMANLLRNNSSANIAGAVTTDRGAW
jgi:hypothetical protein